MKPHCLKWEQINPDPESEYFSIIYILSKTRKGSVRLSTHGVWFGRQRNEHAEMKHIKSSPATSNYLHHRLSSISALTFPLVPLSSPPCCTVDNRLCKFLSSAVYERIPHSNLEEKKKTRKIEQSYFYVKWQGNTTGWTLHLVSALSGSGTVTQYKACYKCPLLCSLNGEWQRVLLKLAKSAALGSLPDQEAWHSNPGWHATWATDTG